MAESFTRHQTSMNSGSGELLTELLKRVSRSFYLTLRVLPGPVRPQIGLAYLLARASDTIADTDALPKTERRTILEEFRDRLSGKTSQFLTLSIIAARQSSPAERTLLERINDACLLLDRTDPGDQMEIRQLLDIIISGQTLDLERFAQAGPDNVLALETREELDDYTYRVAGCVGEFWTRMCRKHLFPRSDVDETLLLRNGVRFGKGLQLVNILRDLPVDLRLGRCYLPREVLSAAGLEPSELLNPATEPRLRQEYERYLELAEEYLQSGWQYTNQLPRGQVRVRLACAWPILIGIQTIGKLRRENILEPSRRIKISRKDVRSVLLRTILAYPWPSRWNQLFDKCKSDRQNTLPRATSLVK